MACASLADLLHAQRIGAQRAVADFAQADVEERFVGALQGVFARQTGQLRHQPDEAHAAHVRDEGVVFRHVADQAAHRARLRPDVAAQNARRAGGGLVETQQRVDQRRFPRAVRPQQADRPPVESRLQLLEDGAAGEAHFQVVQFDDRFHSSIRTQIVSRVFLAIGPGARRARRFRAGSPA